MIVGEAPTEKDREANSPFASTAGWLLDECLKEAGLNRGLAFCTYVGREVPPGGDPTNWIASTIKGRTSAHRLCEGKYILPQLAMGRDLLRQEIGLCRPTVVVAAGNIALWAIAGKWGVRKWRSSILQGEVDGHRFKVIPVETPTSVLREWPRRGLLVHDLRRAKTELGRGPIVQVPAYNFLIRPTYLQAVECLQQLLARLDASPSSIPLAADIETRAGHTACLGIAWTAKDAITIPWMCVERPEGYWELEEELELVLLFNRILTHPKASITWQNGAYDHQYEHRWHFIQPNLGWDTMLAHHSMFSISPKGLDHLSSLYCDYHAYWKDDGKLWDPSIPEDDFWRYNCEDCVRTFEIREAEEAAIAHMAQEWHKLPSVVSFQHALQPAVVRMMLRGVKSDDRARSEMGRALMEAHGRLQGELNQLCGAELNINSPKQMQEFFYETLRQTPIKKRQPSGLWTPTCDDDALETIAAREPVLRPVVARIQALRSGGKFNSTYVQMPRDIDGRLRCSYNVAGTVTYRFSSSENAFGSGGNLQNIPTGDEDEEALIFLPNIRKLFLFDEGMTGFDLDGDSADLRIVTGESGCRQMQAYFSAGAKPYVEIAKEFYRDPTITKSHPSYKRMKALCHGTNYGGESAGLAGRVGLPVHDVDRIQSWYFGMCPEIKRWQDDIRSQCDNRGYIENPFGYRLWRWDRTSRKLHNEFLAWIPQSSVGILINKALLQIDQTLPWCQLLLQVHDSLTGQYPSHMGDEAKRQILSAAEVEIPCKSGTIIVPMGLKTSTKSWGDCEA